MVKCVYFSTNQNMIQVSQLSKLQKRKNTFLFLVLFTCTLILTYSTDFPLPI